MELPELIEPEEVTVDSKRASSTNKVTNLLCLFFDHDCDCSTLPQTLISHGLFPTTPFQPWMAMSVELLSFYHALFEQSCFHMTNQKGTTVKDPFWHGLSQAMQWYAILPVEVEKQVDTTKQEPPSHSCADILIQYVLFGTPLDKGSDIHVAMDGNFHQYHQCSAGDSPSFYEPSYFLPKEQVDAIGCHIAWACQNPSNRTKSIIPDKAIDQCEASYKATDGQEQKASTDSFDDTGLMVLICQHNIPLFFTNIDTPGKQQKYSVTLIDHLLSLLPPQANIVVLYDVGCVLACSLCWFDIFDQAIMSHLHFATSAMHVYGHKWACQLIYNPHLITGLGLSDGEGTECLWSCFIKLIGIEHVSSHQCCIWLLDQHAATIGYGMWTDLRDWVRCHLKKGVHKQGFTAQEVLDNAGVSITELQEQWANQQAAQLSIRAYAPMKLKKELDTVLSLQVDLDTTTKVIQVAWATIEWGNVSPRILDALASMEWSHMRLITKVEALYSSLNVHEQFPELMNISLNSAIGSFFEWDKLDHAVGSKDKPLGRKLHQQMHKAIVKCQPMLMAALCKYNAYCEQLSQLYDPSWAIPLPSSLPTKLVDLQNDVSLMEDVWITSSPGETPSLLKQECCLEEQHHLSLEADNMCCWFRHELSAIQLTDAITGASLSPLSWLSPVDEDMWGATDSLGPDLLDLSLEPEQVTLSDVLGDKLKLEAETLSQVSFKWEIPGDVNLPAIMTPIIWAPAGFPWQTFLLNDTNILMSPITQLNDTCINSCTTLLYSAFHPTVASCAILSTHDLPCICFNAKDDPTWILPIHHSLPVGHWVLCTIRFHSQELFLFDSLAQQKPWRNDIKDIMQLIFHLSSMVTQRLGTACQDQGDWTAYPMLLEPCQTNSHDCGVWVLAQMAAILRGYEVTGIGKHDINHF
ncbi:hypothetical protein EDC04DRAFT_2872922 [Pisolithus marmoratus]|nr:hypothetical protein EDC04DRAFT_2872922 [Pisolithus marmoratus]